MNATTRGFIIFLFILLISVICIAVTFSILPGNNISVGIPVIIVPGEPYDPSLPVESFRWTNTLTATVMADIAILVFLFFAWRTSKGWKKQVPGRFQGWVELLGDFMYTLTKQIGGKNARMLFPLVASIFVFLLAVNWLKLFPGVESVGVLHCAEVGFNGYPAQQVGNGAYQLYVDSALNSGFTSTEEGYHACEHFKETGLPAPAADQVTKVSAELKTAEADLVQQLTGQGVADPAADPQVEALRLQYTEELYEHPSMALTADQIARGAIPYTFVVTPYIRGGSTDLNLTIGLALISVVAIQVFGFIGAMKPGHPELGLNYFQKFINLRALGNAGKNPIGAVDFLVGLIEIISEVGKIVSLAFRLFGNMFAGGIILIVMSFLIALIVPSLFIGLEVIVTTIQALVFALLTLVFSAQALEGHHGDEEHDATHEVEAAH